MAHLDVFIVANSVLIDEHIYALWLSGNNGNFGFFPLFFSQFRNFSRFSVQETCRELIRNGILTEMEEADETCVASEVNDHFRFFALIEKFLENPKRLKEQCHFQLSADVVDMLIER